MTIKWLVFSASAVGMALVFCALTFSQNRVSSYSGSNIRSVDFRNVQLEGNGESNDTIPLAFTNGCSEDARFRHCILRTAYGDLDGDGHDEAALLIRTVNNMTAVARDHIYIISCADGPPKLFARFQPTKTDGYVLSIAALGSNFKIEDGCVSLRRCQFGK